MAKKKQQTKREVRNLAPQRFEIRKNADGSQSISGYAATFGDYSQDLGNFREVVKAGAFKQSLRDNPDVLCLYGHDSNLILGRVGSGTLRGLQGTQVQLQTSRHFYRTRSYCVNATVGRFANEFRIFSPARW